VAGALCCSVEQKGVFVERVALGAIVETGWTPCEWQDSATRELSKMFGLEEDTVLYG